jgi:anti-sigma regulatory factor (Ser/Thr protein kinase)
MYAGDDGFVDGTAPFVRDGLEAEEPIAVMVPARHLDALREELGRDAEHVFMADMEEVGANPARIIPAWRDFAVSSARPGQAMRGIGEPIWASRTPAQLIECQRHESLINVAFADVAGFRLLCPYDVEALDPAVVEEARRSHPIVCEGGCERESGVYRGEEESGAPFDVQLPEPPVPTDRIPFGFAELRTMREIVERRAAVAGLGFERSQDLVLAVGEVTTNSVRHGGGRGVLRVWEDDPWLVCEVRDRGRIDRPLAGRERPSYDRPGGRGLWLANQLCDLVQVRAFAHGGVVRLHMRRG